MSGSASGIALATWPRHRWWEACGNCGLLIGAALVFTAVAVLFSSTQFDDPFITFRYAKHLADGLGPLWNIDEPPVEGYTSTAWMLLSALAISKGYPPLLAARTVGFLAVLVALVSAIFSTRRLLRSWVERATFVFLIAFSADVGLYSLSGMEHIVAVPLMILLLVAVERALATGTVAWAVGSAVLVSALCWFRPEPHLVLVLLAIGIFRPIVSPVVPVRACLAFFGVCALLLVPLHAFRFLYFGALLPNTYWAKHYGGRLIWSVVSGGLYLSEGLKSYVLFILLPAVALLARRNSPASPLSQFTVILSLGWLASILKVGGDDSSAFPGMRLMLPMLPVLFYLTVKAVSELVGGGWRQLLAMVLLLGGFVSTQIPRYWDSARSVTGANNMTGTSLFSANALRASIRGLWAPSAMSDASRFLLENTPRGEAVAIPWAGRISYETDLKVIDLLGLNDRHIAHLDKKQRGIDVKYDASYVLNRHPRFICENFGPLQGVSMSRIAQMSEAELYRAGAWKLGQRELLQSRELQREYETVDYPGMGVCFGRINSGSPSRAVPQ